MDKRQRVEQHSGTPALAVSVRTRDLEAMKEAVAGVPLEVERLAPGNQEMSLAHIGLAGMSLTAGTFGFPLRSRGAIDDHTVTLAVPLGDGRGQWNGEDLDPESAWVYGPGSEHQGLAAHPPPFATLAMSTEAFATYCRAAGDARGTQLGSVVVHRTPAVGRLSALVNNLVSVVPGGPLGERTAGRVEDELGDAVVSLLSATDVTAEDRQSRSSAVSLVEACIDAAEVLGPQPSSTEMSELVGVSDRWIRSGFAEVLGVSPSRYFRSRALHRAHAELRNGHPATTSVTDVAMKWGFWHLGRFSGLYRSYFGELPSETLSGVTGP